MRNKKIILFIVEGLSDESALAPIINKLLTKNNRVRFHVMHFDLSSITDIPYKNDNMKIRIKKAIDLFIMKNRPIKKSDILKVVFITDTDGCFVDEEFVKLDEHAEGFIYKEDGIYANNIYSVIQRNKLKSKNLNSIYSTKKVYSDIDFEAYYFSSNLEHVLHDEQNANDDFKELKAYEFAEKFIGKNEEEKFIEFISNPLIAPVTDYLNSWKFIMEENNSLKRYTNFNVFFLNNSDYFSE